MKIIKKMENIPDDEIRTMMDFDKVLLQHKALLVLAKKALFIKYMFASTFIVGITATTFIYLNNKSENIEPKVNRTSNTFLSKKEIVEIPISVENEYNKVSNDLKSATQEEKTKKVIKQKKVAISEKKTEEFTEAMPDGGYNALYLFFDKNLNYPQEAKEMGLEGEVIVEFYINGQGKAEDVTIIKSLHPILDKEAIRLINTMPKWQSATFAGKVIATKKTIPLTFNLLKK